MQLEQREVIDNDTGSLVEAFKFPHDGQVFYIVVKPHEMRGNHYHLKKVEHFLVVYGSAEIAVRDRQTGNLMKVTLSGNKPLIATVYPNNTHNITASDEGCILLVWASELFDPTNPDTISEEI